MSKTVLYCETLRQAQTLWRWFKTQDFQSDAAFFIVNVMPAFAYADIGEGAASYAWGHPRLYERHNGPLHELVQSLSALGWRAESKLLVGSRAAELSQFCNDQAIDQLCLVKSERFWFDRFMTRQLIKKISDQTSTKIVGVSA